MVEKTVARLLIVTYSCRRDINLGRSFAGRRGRRKASTYGVLYLISPTNTIFSHCVCFIYKETAPSIDETRRSLPKQLPGSKTGSLSPISEFFCQDDVSEESSQQQA
jgi:hypothetical protein